MAVLLTSILKSTPDKMKPPQAVNSQHVKFNIPAEQISVIEYLKETGKESYSIKLNNVAKCITGDSEDSVLLNWIREFNDNILFLDKRNDRIIFALLNLKWFVKNEEFVLLYEEFILNLVTAHTSYLRPVLVMIINTFITVSDSIDVSEEKRKGFENVHRLLKCIIALVPLSPYPLCMMLSHKFPYMKSSVDVLHGYVKNLFMVCSYLPSRRLAILECIIERLIHIDVHCSKETIETSEAEKNEQDNLLLEDMSDGDSNSEKDIMAFPLAHSLDVVLDSLFNFIYRTCFPDGGADLDWEATKKLYKELLTIFDKIILSTCDCCHVQYIMFYICSLKQELCEGFLDYLWKKVQNPNVGSVFRQLAAFYIGSLLARAKYVNISTMCACLDLMCSWIHRYIDNNTDQDLGVHGTFHSVCQTVFYVFAFRSKEFMDLKDGHKYLRGLNFDRIVTCRLNPLKFCDRTIVQNFANISRNFQVAYVFPVIERNNRNLLYANFSANAENVAGAMIKTFFPFDPYLLKRSKHWIEDLYRLYNYAHKDEDAMDQDEVDEISAADALFSYSTSPGFKKSLLKM